jgi:aromatic ring-opening dioxygenase catalytic subunit (LigB family)
MGYKLVSIVSSDKPGKKLKATFKDTETGRTKTTHFGQATADDYTKTHDKEQRARYRQRHAKDLKGDPTKAGYLSMYVLWGNSTSIRDNISAYKSRFNL